MCIVSRPTILGNTKFNISPFILHWQLMTISYFRIIFHTFKGSVSLYLYCNKNRIYYAYVDYRKKSNTNQQTQEFLKEILRSRKLYALEWVVSCSWDIKMIHTLRPKHGLTKHVQVMQGFVSPATSGDQTVPFFLSCPVPSVQSAKIKKKEVKAEANITVFPQSTRVLECHLYKKKNWHYIMIISIWSMRVIQV